MVVGISWTGFSVVGNTVSYFSDTEISGNNVLQVSTLDFSLSGDDFSPDVTPAQNTLRTININNDGSLDFDYNVKSENVSGDLCSSLVLSADLDGVNEYTGAISGFDYSAGQFTTVGGNWQFEINLTSDDLSLQNKTCNFDFVFDGLQIGGIGFFDQEIISNTVNSGIWTITPPPAPEIVINEFLPNPDGVDNASMPGGEWVELYNNSNVDFDVAGWVLYDSDDSHELYIEVTNTNTGDTIVPGHGWLVVYRNGDGDFNLNNDTDSVRLFTGYPVSSSILVDSYSWTTEKPEGFSYARIPDGTGDWVDPIPTPGGPNIEAIEINNLDTTELARQEEMFSPGGTIIGEQTTGQLAEEGQNSEEGGIIDQIAESITDYLLNGQNDSDIICPEGTSQNIETLEEPAENQVIIIQETIVEETEPVMPEESVIIEQEIVIEPEPVVAPVDDSNDNSGEDASALSEAPVAE